MSYLFSMIVLFDAQESLILMQSALSIFSFIASALRVISCLSVAEALILRNKPYFPISVSAV